jgi:WD40 repeat protein
MSDQGGGPAPVAPSCARIATAPGDFNPCGPTNGIAYSPDGKLLAIATASRPPNVHVYRVSDGSLVHALDGIGDQAYAVAFSPDNSVLAVAGQRPDSANGQLDIVKLYDARSGSQLRALPASCGFYADSVAFSLDGTLIATAGFKGPIEIWRVSDGTQVTSIAYPTSVHNVHFAPKGSEIIVGGVDQRATVWAVPSGKQILELSPTTNEQSDATFAPDGAQIATTGPNNDIQIWDTASSKLLQRMSAHTAYVAHVLWLDQDHIVSNDWFGTIKWMSRQSSGDFVVSASWSTGTQSLGIAIAPDGKMLAAGGGDGSNSGFKFFAIDPKQL